MLAKPFAKAINLGVYNDLFDSVGEPESYQ